MATETLATLLLNAAERAPNAPALVTAARVLSYDTLRQRAQKLAAHLVESGVRPGDRVAICLPKGEELSVGIFGVLLAGGCYVPIDYATPAARVRLIVEDADPRAVIFTRRIARQLLHPTLTESEDDPESKSAAAGRQVLVCAIDCRCFFPEAEVVVTPWSVVMSRGEQSVNVPVRPDMRAYILYTSGSTGCPKGVVHTHNSAMTFIQWATDQLELRSEDRVSQHASPSFDLTVLDFFATVMAAATLVSVPEWLFGQVAKTCRFIADHGITVWYSVPSALLREGSDNRLQELKRSSLRRVVFAGETIPQAPLRRLARHLPRGCMVSNWYGPTETNVCTFHDVTATDLESDLSVPIGLPCPYATIIVHQDRERGDEARDSGELLVASPTVMEGYWQLSELTARAFTESETGQRFYRTGDIVSGDTGQLRFLGRRDRLLKIRGYRVQPEEVEQVLQHHDEVVEAAVVAIRRNGLEELAGVVTTKGQDDETLSDLLHLCAKSLPSYMVPTTLIRLPALPRGSRGKIDREKVTALVAPAV